jgi:hypothetical protein
VPVSITRARLAGFAIRISAPFSSIGWSGDPSETST